MATLLASASRLDGQEHRRRRSPGGLKPRSRQATAPERWLTPAHGVLSAMEDVALPADGREEWPREGQLQLEARVRALQEQRLEMQQAQREEEWRREEAERQSLAWLEELRLVEARAHGASDAAVRALALQEHLEILQQQLAAEPARRQHAERQLQDFAREVGTVLRMLTAEKARVARLQAQRAELEAALREPREPVSERCVALELSLSREEAALAGAIREVASLQLEQAELVKLTEAQASTELVLQGAYQETLTMGREHGELRRKLEAKGAQNANMQQHLEAGQAALQRQCSALREQLAAAQGDAQALRRGAEERSTEAAALFAGVGDLRSELEARLNAIERSLVGEQAALGDERAMLEWRLAEEQEISAQVGVELQGRCAELRCELAFEAMRRERMELRLRERRPTLQGRCDELRARAADEEVRRELATAEARSLRLELAECEESRRSLELRGGHARHAEAWARGTASEMQLIESVKARRVELGAALDRAEQECERQAQLQSAEEAELATLRLERDELRQRLTGGRGAVDSRPLSTVAPSTLAWSLAGGSAGPCDWRAKATGESGARHAARLAGSPRLARTSISSSSSAKSLHRVACVGTPQHRLQTRGRALGSDSTPRRSACASGPCPGTKEAHSRGWC